jgi:hypothetical protein
MEFLITESQLKTLLKEEKSSQLGTYMKMMNSFTRQIVSSVQRSYGINLRMLLTWGTSVGGMVLPLDQFLKTEHFSLTEEQRMLVLAGIIFSLFFETSRPLVKLLSLIKKEGLEEIFESGLRKGTQLRNAFSNFMTSLSTGVTSFIDTLAYSFLLPIITDVQSVLSETQDIDEAALLITQRLIASGLVLLSTQSLNKMVKSILQRIG